jgi:flagellar assembly factor FliW
MNHITKLQENLLTAVQTSPYREKTIVFGEGAEAPLLMMIGEAPGGDEEKQGKIMWLQSLDEPQFAIPVVDPAGICADYNPTVNDELLTPLGQFSEESLFVLVTIRVPSDITRMTINLKGPIIINTDNLRGEQIIVEDEVQTRFPIYDILKSRKEKAGE